MQIGAIRTSKNHRAALAEIEKLWGASTGTPEGDKLDILVTLVETYEERRWPLRSRRRFDPVDVLHFAIEELGREHLAGIYLEVDEERFDSTGIRRLYDSGHYPLPRRLASSLP